MLALQAVTAILTKCNCHTYGLYQPYLRFVSTVFAFSIFKGYRTDLRILS